MPCAILMLIAFACNNESKLQGKNLGGAAADKLTDTKPPPAPAPPPAQDQLHNLGLSIAPGLAVERATGSKVVKDEETVYGFATPELKKKDNFNTEDYSPIVENKFLEANSNPLSTFSIDVDEAAYSNVRRYLENGSMPPAGAVRIEEMINYFDYSYPQPTNDHPFSVNTEIADCPWNSQHRLVAAKGAHINGYRAEFIRLAQAASAMIAKK